MDDYNINGEDYLEDSGLESRVSEIKINPRMPSSAVTLAENLENLEDTIHPEPISLTKIAVEGFKGADGVATGLGTIAVSYFAIKYWFSPNIPQIFDFCNNAVQYVNQVING